MKAYFDTFLYQFISILEATMEAELFAQMLADEKQFVLKRMQYKYSAELVAKFVGLL